ncbi:MAG TPA: Gfo/Idh/MocA family oxidoreductase [Gemmataceae bacterium]|nr:Gfo/Idh/MocA family oxidoreductase [Gemmataceae bacterium]
MSSNSTNSGMSRRELIKTSGKVVAATTLAGMVVPNVHAGENNEIKIALVGCGGRGTGAAENAMKAKNGNTKLVAMADVFKSHLQNSHNVLKGNGSITKQIDVPDHRRFVSFDGYKHAMDCLNPGDIVILTTPPAFRWVHFTYAIQKGLNVFMEKPVAVDAPAARKMLQLGKEAQKKNLKVGVGLMCRHCRVRAELYKRIKDGQIGDIVSLRAYRQAGHTAKENAPWPPREGMSELLHQIYWFHSFLWASGGCYSDFLIHHIDECCWMKDAWPVMVKGSGGREYNNTKHNDQNFDTYSIEYIFGDGARLHLEGRTIPGCASEFASYAHGTKGSAVISRDNHSPAHCRIYKGQNMARNHNDPNITWKWPSEDEPNPYQTEWDDLIEAIHQDKPYNEVERGTMAALVTAMGRYAAHTGQMVKLAEYLHHNESFAPDVDKLTYEYPAPVLAAKDGKYPVPQPGRHSRNQEYYVRKT